MKVCPTVPTSSKELFSWLVKTLYYGFKSIGLAPLSIESKMWVEKTRHSSIKVFLFSKIGLLYNLAFVILIQIINIMFKFPILFCRKYGGNYSIPAILNGVVEILNISTSSFIVLYLAFRQKKFAIIMNRLLDVHFLLSSAKAQLSNKKTYIFLSVQMIFHVSLLTTSFSTDSIFEYIWDMLFTDLIQLILYWFVVEYSLILGIVARELEILNHNLSILKEFPNHLFRTSLPNQHLAILGLPTHSQLATIKLLHSVYTTLFEVVQEIGDFFSVPILLTITCIFLTLINAVYTIMVWVFHSRNDFSSNFILYNMIVWIVRTISPLVLLCFNATETAKKAKLTARIVHKLLTTARKQEIIRELEQFSFQLLHEDVIFTAYGFFNLDCTLLYSIFGAVATYLVIVIQFVQSNSHKD